MAELDITRGARGNPTIAPHVIPDRALLGTLHELFKQIGCVLYILDTIKSWYDRLPALGTKNARGEASENLGPDRQQRLYEKLYGTPHFTKMIPHIVCFGVDGDIDGRELRRRLPEIMNISAEDLAIRQPRGADTMFEMYVRHAIKGAGSQGLLENLGGKRYRITEAGRAWLTEHADQPALTVGEAPPDGTWFARAYHAKYHSEKEVDIRFVVQLLEHLGYQEDDRADGFWMDINIGSRVIRVQADFVCYDGPNRSLSSCILLVETKFAGASLQKALNQARSYAQVLKPVRLLITNGEEIEVWHRSDTAEDTKVFTCKRKDLYSHFEELVAAASKSVLAAEKRAANE